MKMENVEAQTTPQPTPKNAKSCSKIMVYANLISRILTFIFLLVALIILATNTGILATTAGDFGVHFHDIIAYRYVMSAIVIGFVYTLVQIGFSLYQVIMGKRLSNAKAMLLFDFYADKVVSGLLATAAGAGFGVTIDIRPVLPSLDDYFNKGNATASLVLFAYFFSEVSQIVSSFALPN